MSCASFHAPREPRSGSLQRIQKASAEGCGTQSHWVSTPRSERAAFQQETRNRLSWNSACPNQQTCAGFSCKSKESTGHVPLTCCRSFGRKTCSAGGWPSQACGLGKALVCSTIAWLPCPAFAASLFTFCTETGSLMAAKADQVRPRRNFREGSIGCKDGLSRDEGQTTQPQGSCRLNAHLTPPERFYLGCTSRPAVANAW